MSTHFDPAEHPRGDGDGKFTETAKADPGNEVLMHRHPAAALDDPRVVAALGYGPSLNDTEKEVLLILLDPSNDPWESCDGLDDVLSEWNDFDNRGGVDGEEKVASWLQNYYDKAEGYGEFEFNHIYSSDGTVEIYEVSTRMPGNRIFCLSLTEDVKHLWSREHVGLRAALHTATVLAGDHDMLVAEKRRLSPTVN